MYVNALRKAFCHQSGSTFACVELSLLLYISLYSCQGTRSSARYKRRAEGSPGRTILYTFTNEVQGSGQSTAVSNDRLLASIPWFIWMSHLVNVAQGGSLVAWTRNKENRGVPKRRCRDYEASGVATYIEAAWLAAGGGSGKREMCREKGTHLKLTDAAKHPS